jgi:hypothetical protein
MRRESTTLCYNERILSDIFEGVFMSDFFKGIAGWERHGGEMLLRLNLAEPRLTRVWPGSPSADEPQGEMRLLSQMMLTRADVRKAITDRVFAQNCGYSAEDVALLRRALNEPPETRKARRWPDGPHQRI